jgi:hypothetical protein
MTSELESVVRTLTIGGETLAQVAKNEITLSSMKRVLVRVISYVALSQI